MFKVKVEGGPKIEDYKSYATLSHAVKKYLEESEHYLNSLKDSTIWMINSTETGGGVAEMLPSQIRILREQGLKVEWLVMETDDDHFFEITKKIHNGIHGAGDVPRFTRKDKHIYEAVNRQNAEQARRYIKEGDIVIAHDPQPLGMIHSLKEILDIKVIWRCHIGCEEKNEVTTAAWEFIKSYVESFDHLVFSIPDYVPDFVAQNYSIIPPAIDPLSHKNRTLQLHKCIGILHQSGIINDKEPILYKFYTHPVKRVMPDGSFGAVNELGELDIIFRPSILQVSRWDRLKGFKEVLNAFIALKKSASKYGQNDIQFKRLNKARLILAGPDPSFVKDDPEGEDVLNELVDIFKNTDQKFQADIAILLLPMEDGKQNALIVNALQRSSSIIVQNSIQEGFGLTATEAMWKQIPIIVSSAAGLRFQVEHEKNGLIIGDATNLDELTGAMDRMLVNPKTREKWGFNGQIRVIERFTIFSQLNSWLTLMSNLQKH